MIIVVVAVLWFGGRCNRGGKAGDGGEASGDVMGCGGMGEKLVDDGGLKLKHAVAIMNIKCRVAGIIGLVEVALMDAYLGHAGMLLITSVLYSIVSHRNSTHPFHLWHSTANLLLVVVVVLVKI
ncbi:hypothetical protein LOK49_LG08G02472 [Camellia lanceoleosa]|uniref:Uncharacterized protein n=1 Tax=Camellia lanceoleosa TaxID=1840588 RepID=A0ACC0GTY0_9ERIC|nr:hypothetical protein LOK49_LG08G02472 [Camellia lanceoleosa]